MKFLKVLGKPFTALAGKVDRDVEQKVLMSVARKVAMAAGVLLVQQGYVDASHLAEFVGSVLTLVAIFSGTQNAVNHAEY